MTHTREAPSGAQAAKIQGVLDKNVISMNHMQTYENRLVQRVMDKNFRLGKGGPQRPHVHPYTGKSDSAHHRPLIQN